jgi:hypothetical protein
MKHCKLLVGSGKDGRRYVTHMVRGTTIDVAHHAGKATSLATLKG